MPLACDGHVWGPGHVVTHPQPVAFRLLISGRNLGTVGAVALDSTGNVAYATSTGGIVNKMVGRVGDTPCIGSPGGWLPPPPSLSASSHALLVPSPLPPLTPPPGGSFRISGSGSRVGRRCLMSCGHSALCHVTWGVAPKLPAVPLSSVAPVSGSTDLVPKG